MIYRRESDLYDMPENMNRAKEMFWQYACNHFFIAHDGVHEEYAKLGGGDEEAEATWRAEFISDQLSNLSIEDFDPLQELRNANAGEAIPALLEVDDYGDDYSRFWYAFTLHDLARYETAPKANKKRALSKASELWNGILKKPVGISEVNRSQVGDYMLENLQAKTAEGYVTNYTESKLQELEGTTRRWWQRR